MTTHYRLPCAKGEGVKLQGFEKEVMVDIEGLVLEKCLPYVQTFPYQKDDILICASPKNGNHWMGNMVWKLKTLTDYKRPKINVLELDVEGVFNSKDIQESPRILQSHMRPFRLPKEHLENKGKVVLLLRNPKDACVSFYHHFKNADAFKSEQTFDEFFESYFNGLVWYPILDYMKEWEDYLYDQSTENAPVYVEIFYYEDCKRNPMDNLKRLNKFLGFDRDEAYLEKVLEQTGFEAMKTHENSNKEGIHFLCHDDIGNSIIYRKGGIGDWKNHFTVAQSEKIDALMKEKLTKDIIKRQFE